MADQHQLADTDGEVRLFYQVSVADIAFFKNRSGP